VAARQSGLRKSWFEDGRTSFIEYSTVSLSQDRILANAAAVTFYTLLAVFPLIATLVSVYGFFLDSRTIADQVSAMSGVLPGGAVDVIRDELNRLTSQPKGKLGMSFLIALGVSLWSANGGIKAILML